MTPQEQQMLGELVNRIQSTQLPGKDAEAEQYIQQSLGRNPDALYILCQTVLVQQYALDQAQRQLAEARQQLEQQQGAGKHTSFLGRIFGGDDPASARPQPPAGGSGQGYAPVAYPGQANYAGQPGYPPPPPGGYVAYPPQGYAPAGYGMGGGMGGGFGSGGFLQGALQTAAGVAAGELAFRGIEGLLHGFGHAAGYESDRALGGFDDGRGFFGDDSNRDRGEESFGDQLQASHPNEGLSPDIEDRRGDDGGRGFFGGDANGGTDSFADTGDVSQDSDQDSDQDVGGGDFDDGSGGGDDFSGNDDNF